MAAKDVSSATRDLVYDRAGTSCERCGRRPGWMSIHHRRTRSIRDEHTHAPGNLLLLCGTGSSGCHGYVHANPAEARDEGFIVSRWEEEPGRVGVLLAGHGWAFLNADGSVTDWVGPLAD